MIKPSKNTAFVDQSENAKWLLQQRYCLNRINPDTGEVEKENCLEHVATRVARIVAAAESLYTDDIDRIKAVDDAIFFDIMAHRFLFNSPCLFNAGSGMIMDKKLSKLVYKSSADTTIEDYRALQSSKKDAQQLFACFVIGIEDSLEGIFDSVKDAAIISKFGGGVGANFSKLREAGASINGGMNGKSSGPVSFMETWNTMGNVVVQGGCFVGDTFIATPNGAVKIKDLKEGDIVYSWDGEFSCYKCSGSWVTRRFTEVWKIETNIGLSFLCTPDHPLMRLDSTMEHKEYFKARDSVGRELKTYLSFDPFPDRGIHKVTDATFSHYEDVYNVEVPGPHNYVVCDEYMTTGVVVSNTRRSALMGMMDDNHPDIDTFINAKTEDGKLPYFNISVAISDKLMKAVEEDGGFDLISRLDGSVVRTVKARELWDSICEKAWRRGDPGIFFKDRANEDSLLRGDSQYHLSSTNPSLVAGTKVLTNQGIFNIEDLQGQSFRVPSILSDSSKAICIMSGENKQVREIVFAPSFSATATMEHKWPVLTLDGTVKRTPTSSLKRGDKIVKPRVRRTLGFGTLGSFDEGVFIGTLYGSGYISGNIDGDTSGGVNIHVELRSPELVASMADTIRGVATGLSEKGFPETKEDGFYEVVLRTGAFKLLSERFGVDRLANGLPRKIWTECSDEFRCGFIKAFFSTTMKVNQYGHFSITKNDNIKADIATLLGMYGICCDQAGKKKQLCWDANAITLIKRLCGGELFTKAFDEAIERSKRKYIDYMTVVDIRDAGVADKVWDLRVDDESHSFCIGPVMTGNCGEQPLPDYSSCNLGSINLSVFVNEDGKFEEEEFKEQVHRSMYYLDLVIDATSFPLERIETRTKAIRPAGVGIMGLADAAIKMGIQFGSGDFMFFCDRIGRILAEESLIASINMAKDKGPFPESQLVAEIMEAFRDKKEQLPPTLSEAILHITGDQQDMVWTALSDGMIRNSRRLSIAPTGSISMLLDSSPGIEPNFAWNWSRKITNPDDPTGFTTKEYFHPLLSESQREEVIKDGKVTSSSLFVSAHDVYPCEHVASVARFAKFIDSGISKTVGLPESATVEDVKEVYKACYDSGAKGITIYRDGSRTGQPIETTKPAVKAPQEGNLSPKVKERSSNILNGKTIKDVTPWGGLYVTMNYDNGEPFEVFASLGKSGSEIKSMAEALSRVISIGLRSGCKLEDIVATLKGISGKEVWTFDCDDDTIIRSIPDGIAVLIERLTGGTIKPECEQKPCPECGSPMELVGGCAYCYSCGYSPCK